MPKRSAKDAAITRARILSEAELLFARKGFAGTSTEEIAHAADVTIGALFHHFKTKKDLFSEIVVKLHAAIHKDIYKAGMGALTPIDGFRLGARASMRITQKPHNQRIVFIEGPVVLGTEKWREIDQQLGLRLIEGGLLQMAGVDAMPDAVLKPMAMMALGTINEITYALIQKVPGIDPEQCLDLLERGLMMWLENDVKAWKQSIPAAG